MERARFESPLAKGAVVAVAAAGIYYAFLRYDNLLRQPVHEISPYRHYRIMRQVAEADLTRFERRTPGAVASIWIEGPDVGPTDPTEFEIVDSHDRKYQVFQAVGPFGSRFITPEGQVRLDVPGGYGRAPDMPVLRVLEHGVEKWRTPLQPLPEPRRLLMPAKDDPRLSVSMVQHSDSFQIQRDQAIVGTTPSPHLKVQLNRQAGPGETIVTEVLATTFRAARGFGLGSNPAYFRVGYYPEDITEAQVRVTIRKLQPATREIAIHGVAIEVFYGQPVAIVRKAIQVSSDVGGVRIMVQGRPLQMPPRAVHPSISVAGFFPGPREATWLGPSPEELGLSRMQFGGLVMEAKGPHGPPHPVADIPIRLRIAGERVISQEQYTVTVPVHRERP